MRLCFMLVACCLAISVYAQKKNTVPSQTDRFAGLDTAFERVLKDQLAAGFAVAVVEKDKIVYAKGFGYRDYEKKLPVTPNTLFAIGSCTKAFTSSLLGILQKDKKIDFDEPAVKYLPSLKFYNEDMDKHISIRDMMSHRTGLPRHDYSWYLFKTNSRDTLLQRIRYQQPSFGIRERWQYNNFMFLTQGLIAEKLTGKSWEENISTHIFQPLGMTRSNTSIEALTKDADAAIGYGVKKDSIIDKLDYYHINAMGPAGSINSSVNEMARWVITWINGGKYEGKEIVPAGYISTAMTAQMVAGPGLPSKERTDVFFSSYGMGWSLASYKGHYRVEHGGNIDGFSASTSFFPTDSIGIIVLTNQNASSVTAIVRNMIADRLLKIPYFNWNRDVLESNRKAKEAAKEAEKTTSSNQQKNTKPSHALKDYEGIYSHPGYGSMELITRNDSLFGYISNNDVTWLKHYHYDVFSPFNVDKDGKIDTSGNSPLKFQFFMNESGEINALNLKLEPTLDALRFTKSPRTVKTNADDLQKYVGEYELGGATVKVSVKNNTLFTLVPGQPEYEMSAMGNDRFALKIAAGYYVQFEVKDKEVTQLTFQQPNGNFVAKRKK
ncbi:MAG TPA: penicillin-binding protein [Chitinophagaceae bacterium]|nr:penicillin-binding protein [Chitinophagaceae bacterium]